jgi:predicted heme/steroid binding protein
MQNSFDSPVVYALKLAWCWGAGIFKNWEKAGENMNKEIKFKHPPI